MGEQDSVLGGHDSFRRAMGARRYRARRPLPSVRRVPGGVRRSVCVGAPLISVTQRDDTLLLAPEQARRLARALLRAADARGAGQ